MLPLFLSIAFFAFSHSKIVHADVVKHSNRSPKPRKTFWVASPSLECDLNIQLFPLFYTPITRVSQLRLSFTSNCFSERLRVFETNHFADRRINWNYHPTVLNLMIFGNWYRVTFSNPRVVDRYDVMRALRYRTATIATGNQVVTVDLRFRNQISLPQQIFTSFRRQNFARFRQLPPTVNCTTVARRTFNFQVLETNQQEFLRSMRAMNIPVFDPLTMADYLPSQRYPPSLTERFNMRQGNATTAVLGQNRTQANRQLNNLQMLFNTTLNQTMREKAIQQELVPGPLTLNPSEEAEEAERLQVRQNRVTRLKRRFIEDIELLCEIK